MNNGHRPRHNQAKKETQFWPTARRLVAYLAPWKWGVIVSVIMAICYPLWPRKY